MTAAKANRSTTRARGHECYHCKQWVEADAAHDCWTTTEAALTRELSEDLRDAWERLRETAVSFGDQRIYASHSSIMFARKSCYFFVRPKRSYLEVIIFLGRAVKSPLVKKVGDASKVKKYLVIQIRHRDQVEPPITDWMREAYDFEPVKKTVAVPKPVRRKPAKKAKKKRS
jgi:hypothetical protein